MTAATPQISAKKKHTLKSGAFFYKRHRERDLNNRKRALYFCKRDTTGGAEPLRNYVSAKNTHKETYVRAKKPCVSTKEIHLQSLFHCRAFSKYSSCSGQHTATQCSTRCNTLHHTATHCNTLHRRLRYTLQHTATHCNTLQHTHLEV